MIKTDRSSVQMMSFHTDIGRIHGAKGRLSRFSIFRKNGRGEPSVLTSQHNRLQGSTLWALQLSEMERQLPEVLAPTSFRKSCSGHT